MTVGGLAATLALVTVVGALAPSSVSHREALQISRDPVADNTDTYAFVNPDKPDTTVTLVGNWIPLEEPAGDFNFHNFGDDVKYTLNVDNDGSAVDDVVWEFRFSTKVQNGNTFLYNTGPITSLKRTPTSTSARPTRWPRSRTAAARSSAPGCPCRRPTSARARRPTTTSWPPRPSPV